MIEADNISFSYGKKLVISQVSLQGQEHRVTGLIGPNGSGKSTLLRLLYAALKPASGHLYFRGQDMAALDRKKLAQGMAVVTQEGSLATGLTARELVLLGRYPHLKYLQQPTAADREIAEQALQQMNALSLAQRPFADLSGGEKQRVLIARALAQSQDYLLLDEPTNHLDIRYQHELLTILKSSGRSVVVVLHDLNLAAQYCDDIYLLDAGQIVNSGPADRVLTAENLEGVYGVKVERVYLNRQLHLLFARQKST